MQAFLHFFERHETLGFITLYVACNVVIYVIYIQGFSKGQLSMNYGAESNEELGLIAPNTSISVNKAKSVQKTISKAVNR